jgi:hypothetical protein
MGEQPLVSIVVFRHRRSDLTCPKETGGIVSGNGGRHKERAAAPVDMRIKDQIAISFKSA